MKKVICDHAGESPECEDCHHSTAHETVPFWCGTECDCVPAAKCVEVEDEKGNL